MTENSFRTVTYRLAALTLASGLVLGAGCASTEEDEFDKADAGQIIGGVAGAAAGSQIGDGSGQTVATVAGALVGAMLGERVGARMEEDDREYAAEVLEENQSGETGSWENPDTGAEYWVTPTETFEYSGRPCREFEFRVETEEGTETEERTACRDEDGTWEVLG